MEQIKRKAAYVATIAALTVALAAVGCGGSGKADPLKKSEFVAQADAICRTANSERTKAMREAASGQSEATELVTETALPPIQKMTEELGGLGAPVHDRKEVQAIVAAFEQGIKELEADPTSLHTDIHAFDKADELSEAYGLVDCTI